MIGVWVCTWREEVGISVCKITNYSAPPPYIHGGIPSTLCATPPPPPLHTLEASHPLCVPPPPPPPPPLTYTGGIPSTLCATPPPPPYIHGGIPSTLCATPPPPPPPLHTLEAPHPLCVPPPPPPPLTYTGGTPSKNSVCRFAKCFHPQFNTVHAELKQGTSFAPPPPPPPPPPTLCLCSPEDQMIGVLRNNGAIVSRPLPSLPPPPPPPGMLLNRWTQSKTWRLLVVQASWKRQLFTILH